MFHIKRLYISCEKKKSSFIIIICEQIKIPCNQHARDWFIFLIFFIFFIFFISVFIKHLISYLAGLDDTNFTFATEKLNLHVYVGDILSQGCQLIAPKRVTFALNGTNLEFFKSSSKNVLKSYLKKSRICSIWGQSNPLLARSC